MIYKIFYCRQ